MAWFPCSTGELHLGILREDKQTSLFEMEGAWKFEYDEKVTVGALEARSFKGCISEVGFGVYTLKGCITVNSDRYCLVQVFLFALRWNGYEYVSWCDIKHVCRWDEEKTWGFV